MILKSFKRWGAPVNLEVTAVELGVKGRSRMTSLRVKLCMGVGGIRTGVTELARVQAAVFFVASGNTCLHAPHLQTGQSARGGCRDPLERGPRLPAW